jgi:hypothetical protein
MVWSDESGSLQIDLFTQPSLVATIFTSCARNNRGTQFLGNDQGGVLLSAGVKLLSKAWIANSKKASEPMRQYLFLSGPNSWESLTEILERVVATAGINFYYTLYIRRD